MVTSAADETIQSIEIIQEERIAASIDIVFETILEQLGPLNTDMNGQSMCLKLEAWPGGRWYRDLGNNAGHLWAHVQAIKPPTLIEFYGPLFMSFAVASNVQYRLSEEGGLTLLKFVHRVMGRMPAELQGNMDKGWSTIHARIQQAAEHKGKANGKGR